MNKIAIIGGGPAGIIAAKELSEKGLKSTIFEATSALGGIWSSKNHRTWKSLHTNLSKYTCSFSDFPWPRGSSLFPAQNEVEGYLQQFCNKYLANNEVKINCQVNKISRDSQGSFNIEWVEKESNSVHSAEFDQVIVTSGFFSTPDHLDKIKISNPSFQVLSSNQYLDPQEFRSKNVLVVGGSFSGMEIAAEITKTAKNVYHVFPKHTYVVPKYLPENMKDPGTVFVPLDYSFYKLRDDRLQKIQNNFYDQNAPENLEILFKSDKETQQTHDYFQQLLSGPKGSAAAANSIYFGQERKFLNLPPGTSILDETRLSKPTIAISEEYSKSLLHADNLHLILGRVQEIANNQVILTNNLLNDPKSFTLEELLSSRENPLPPIDSCILCTGYRPNLSFLEKDILQTLQYQESNSFQPVVLYKDMFHADIPGLYFVGMYKGPYFGIIEMQAKYVAGLITQTVPMPSKEKYGKEIELATANRDQIKKPQFPHADYVGLMFDLASELKLIPSSMESISKYPFITPFTFNSQAEAVREEIHEVMQDYEEGRNIPKIIIKALENANYSFHREIFNRLDNSFTYVNGTISFERIPSMPISDEQIQEMCSSCSISSSSTGLPVGVDSCSSPSNQIDDDRIFLLYREKGMIELPNKQKFEVNQHYIYHYNPHRNTLELFFCKRDNIKMIDYHFLSLRFSRKESSSSSLLNGWIGKNDHLCIDDLYQANFFFQFHHFFVKNFTIQFDVQGPSKDYTSITELTLHH